MISNQVIQASINDLKTITRVDICVMDLDGNELAATFEHSESYKKIVDYFVSSPADSQEIQGSHYFKVYDKKQAVYILVTKAGNEDAHTIGKVAVSQLQHLLAAYKEKYDKNNFMQNLLLDNLLRVDIYNRAKQLHIETEARRVVFIVETKYEKDNTAMETVKNLFSDKNRDFVTAVDEKSIILVKELKRYEGTEELAKTADMLVDMLNAEAMLKVRVSYGTIVNEIKNISKSYKEAKMALDVGRIFYSQKAGIAYSTLGIGRLIYQLPVPLCDMFLKEVFEGHAAEEIDDETLMTINKFFETDLNVSETARQLYVHRNTLTYRLEKIEKLTGLDIKKFEDAMTFKIALMVSSYMKYKEDHD